MLSLGSAVTIASPAVMFSFHPRQPGVFVTDTVDGLISLGAPEIGFRTSFVKGASDLNKDGCF